MLSLQGSSALFLFAELIIEEPENTFDIHYG